MKNIIIILLVIFTCSCAYTPSPPNEIGKNTNRTDFNSTVQINNLTKGIFPVHGNWCGPLHPKKNLTVDPVAIDQLDEICRKHDKCYQQNYYTAVICDQKLINDINQTVFKTSEQKIIAFAIKSYFTVSPSFAEVPIKLIVPIPYYNTVKDNDYFYPTPSKDVFLGLFFSIDKITRFIFDTTIDTFGFFVEESTPENKP